MFFISKQIVSEKTVLIWLVLSVLSSIAFLVVGSVIVYILYDCWPFRSIHPGQGDCLSGIAPIYYYLLTPCIRVSPWDHSHHKVRPHDGSRSKCSNKKLIWRGTKGSRSYCHIRKILCRREYGLVGPLCVAQMGSNDRDPLWHNVK